MDKKVLCIGLLVSVCLGSTISYCSAEQMTKDQSAQKLTLSEILSESPDHAAEIAAASDESKRLSLPAFELQDNSPKAKRTFKGRLVSLWHKIWPTTQIVAVHRSETFEEIDLAEQVKARVIGLHTIFTPQNSIYQSLVNNNKTRGKTLTVIAALFGCHQLYKTMNKEVPFVLGFVQRVARSSVLKLGLVAAVGLATKFVVPRIMTHWQTKGIKQQRDAYVAELKTQLEPHKDKPGLREYVLEHEISRRAKYESLVSYLLPTA